MENQKKPNKTLSLALAVCLGFLALSWTGCKNPTGAEDQQPYITVQNSCGISLDIYMDGTFQFYLDDNEYYVIENVIPGTHDLEARKKDTNIVLKSLTVETTADNGYTWTISSNAQLIITNHYGETVDIYGDGTFQSELPDQTDLAFATIPYGEHIVEAKKQGGTTVVASLTIEIIEDIAYTWIIEKP